MGEQVDPKGPHKVAGIDLSSQWKVGSLKKNAAKKRQGSSNIYIYICIYEYDLYITLLLIYHVHLNLEPKWPFFWLEKNCCFGGAPTFQKKQVVWAPGIYTWARVDQLLVLGMGTHPTFNDGNPYNWVLNPYGLGLIFPSPIIWKCHGSWSTRSHTWQYATSLHRYIASRALFRPSPCVALGEVDGEVRHGPGKVSKGCQKDGCCRFNQKSLPGLRSWSWIWCF